MVPCGIGGILAMPCILVFSSQCVELLLVELRRGAALDERDDHARPVERPAAGSQYQDLQLGHRHSPVERRNEPRRGP